MDNSSQEICINGFEHLFRTCRTPLDRIIDYYTKEILKYGITPELDYEVGELYTDIAKRYENVLNSDTNRSVMEFIAHNKTDILNSENPTDYIYQHALKPTLDMWAEKNRQIAAKKAAKIADENARIEEIENIARKKIADISGLICKKLKKTPTDELDHLVAKYKYNDSLIIADPALQNNDIANIIISMYPKAESLHTDTLDALFSAGAMVKDSVKKVSVKTGDKQKRISIKYKLPDEVLLDCKNETDQEVEASIIEFLSLNKWRDYNYKQLLEKVAPNYANKTFTVKKSGKELSVFNGLLQNTVKSKTIIKTDVKDGDKVYTNYKYCPEKCHLNAATDRQWLDYICKIINMALKEIEGSLTQTEIYELTQIYCGSMRREKVLNALKFMVAVGHLKTHNGACNRTYYYIDAERDIEQEKRLRKELYGQYT